MIAGIGTAILLFAIGLIFSRINRSKQDRLDRMSPQDRATATKQSLEKSKREIARSMKMIWGFVALLAVVSLIGLIAKV